MPFTPFHMGPGLTLKALAGERFSLVAFGLAQVVIDIEPLLGLINDWPVLHGWTHSLIGATALGLATAAITPLAARPLLKVWNAIWRREQLHGFCESARVSWLAAFSGALLGAWTHVLLDGVMHNDLLPFWPWSAQRPWLHAISVETLHLACVALAVPGVVVWLWRGWRRQQFLRQ